MSWESIINLGGMGKKKVILNRKAQIQILKIKTFITKWFFLK